MPLIDLRTDLKDLKYGADRPGGGSSGQPYIQFPIDGPNVSPSIRRYYEINRTSLDYPVRGGLISQYVAGVSSIVSSGIDRERIAKFFRDSPRGTAFIQKQIGLQLSNPRTQVASALAFAGNQVGAAILPVTNTYNPLNTLAQVQAQGTGVHFNRHGLFPTLINNEKVTYEYIAGAPENNVPGKNRLLVLQEAKLFVPDFLTDQGLANAATVKAEASKLGISTNSGELFNYSGGPGSVYGIGSTTIRRFPGANTEATELSKVNPNPKFSNQGVTAQPYSAIALTYTQLANQLQAPNPTDTEVLDFRTQLPSGSTPTTDYSRYNLITTYGIGDPGQPRSRVNYRDTGSLVGVDRVNAIDPKQFNPTNQSPWDTDNGSRDLIKFAFECIDNDNVANSIALLFRAFLDGSITDTNTPEFSPFKYLGRGETFRTYQGFDRSISFSFTIMVQSRQEMRPLYKKLNVLMSQAYPDYSPVYNLMRGNVVRLTIGDYLYRVPGFLTEIGITIDNSTTSWEILLEGDKTEPDVRQLPMLIKVQCSFAPIMDFLPRKVTFPNNTQVPLIGNKDYYLDVSGDNDDLVQAGRLYIPLQPGQVQ